MDVMRRIAKPVSHLLLAGFLTLSIQMPAAQAGMIGTDAVVGEAAAQVERARIHAILEQRADLRAELAARGVSAEQVAARVDSLTDEEVHALAGQIDKLPAGGDGLGLLVFVFVVLLITDILGFTDIFPFVKKTARR